MRAGTNKNEQDRTGGIPERALAEQVQMAKVVEDVGVEGVSGLIEREQLAGLEDRERGQDRSSAAAGRLRNRPTTASPEACSRAKESEYEKETKREREMVRWMEGERERERSLDRGTAKPAW